MKCLIVYVALLALAAAYDYPPPGEKAKSETPASSKSSTIASDKSSSAPVANVAISSAPKVEVKGKEVAAANIPAHNNAMPEPAAHRSAIPPAIPYDSHHHFLLENGYAAVPYLLYYDQFYDYDYFDEYEPIEQTYKEYFLPSLRGLYALSRLPYSFPITSIESNASPGIMSTYASTQAGVSPSAAGIPPVAKLADYKSVPGSTTGTHYTTNNGGAIYNKNQ